MKMEIKFRCKRVDNGEWEYGSLVMVCNGETLKRYPCIVISYNHDTFDWHEVIPETVGQFISLKDKNGKEIFDGDKMSYKKHSGYILEDCMMIVQFDNEAGCFGYSSDKCLFPELIFPFAQHDDLQNDVLNHCEIIGNIQEI